MRTYTLEPIRLNETTARATPISSLASCKWPPNTMPAQTKAFLTHCLGRSRRIKANTLNQRLRAALSPRRCRRRSAAPVRMRPTSVPLAYFLIIAQLHAPSEPGCAVCASARTRGKYVRCETDRVHATGIRHNCPDAALWASPRKFQSTLVLTTAEFVLSTLAVVIGGRSRNTRCRARDSTARSWRFPGWRSSRSASWASALVP